MLLFFLGLLVGFLLALLISKFRNSNDNDVEETDEPEVTVPMEMSPHGMYTPDPTPKIAYHEVQVMSAGCPCWACEQERNRATAV